MSEIKEVWDMLWDVYDKAKGTPWENVVPVVVIGAGKEYLIYIIIFQKNGLLKRTSMRN